MSVKVIGESGNYPEHLRLITKYRYSNTKFDVSAITIDITTNTITIPSHGLTTSNYITLLFNGYGTGANSNDVDRMLPGGLSAITRYFVINPTTDTFQLSTTNGGSAIDITSVGETSGWWMEPSVYSPASTVFTNLGKLKKMRLIVTGPVQALSIMNINGVNGDQFINDGAALSYSNFGLIPKANSSIGQADFTVTPEGRILILGKQVSNYGAGGSSSVKNSITHPNAGFINGIDSFQLGWGGSTWYDGFTVEIYEILGGI